jgi:small subunit ribosomal protein S6
MRPSLKEADRKKIVETVTGWLGKAKIAKENDWGQKALAYPIKKEDAGYYLMLQLESEEGIPADLETRILRNDSIIRHILLRTK